MNIFNAALKRLKEISKQVDNQQVKVGVPKEPMHNGHNRPTKSGKPRKPQKPIPVVQIAMIHEFGSDARGIPERSFLRSTLNNNKDKYSKLLETQSKHVVKGNKTPSQALGEIGNDVRNDIIRTINAMVNPPLKQETIDAKGSSKLLRDTGQLRQSITYKVNNEAWQKGAK